MTTDPIEVMARSMLNHEWRESKGKHPEFEGEEAAYWMGCATATMSALTAQGYPFRATGEKATGIVNVPA
jgi:hypothetical protein